MKKLFVSMFAVAAALFATSCTNESLEQYDVVGDSNVTFTVTSPELATRAYYGDGDEAQDLYYGVYVYSADGTTKQLLPNISKKDTPVKMENLTAQVQLQLVKGKTYDIIFWAENEKNDAVTVDWNAQTMTYAPQAANVEAYDSFWATKTVEVTGPMTDDVYLYRPFAQINIGTDDVQAAANAGLVVNGTALGVAGVYSSMNLFDGKVDATATATFAQAALPTAGQFPVAGYEYLSMNYVLVGDAKSLSTVTFHYYEEGNLTPYEAVYTNVPVQRNYRTNIYGSILTDPYDIKVEIKPEWEDELPGGEMANTVFDALYYGGEVVLTEDVTLRGFVTVTKNATIDLNGHTLTYEYNPDALNGSAIMARVENGATLTFKGAGKVESDYYIASANAGGTVVVEGTADYVAATTTFQANGGKVYIKGGKFSVNDGDATYLLNHIDSQKNNGLIEVTGGTFVGFNPADNKAENPQMSFVKAGYESIDNLDGTYTVIEGGVKTASELNEAIANANEGDEIQLASGVTIEGTFKPLVKNLKFWSLNGATIKGRVNIDGYGDGCSFENIKFEINDASKVKNSFSGGQYKYPAIVVIYSSAAKFENCEFACSMADAVAGINYGAHAEGKKLVVNNCSFKGDFYAIRSRTLFEITNSKFDVYTTLGDIAVVWTWGNGNSWTDEVTFTGNTNVNAHKVYSVQMSSTTFTYNNIAFNVQGNTGFYALADGTSSNCTYKNNTFAAGSETF